jgi:AcrR family transcriptional regulator
MRVTAQQKEVTRQRLVRSAADLFRDRGFAATTTRAIAKKARLASGTMFNYYPTKEELGLELLVEVAEQAHREFLANRRPTGTVEEWLYNLLAVEMRHFQPLRSLVANVVPLALRAVGPADGPTARFRAHHLEQVHAILDHFNLVVDARSTSWQHLYWSLYVGIMAHWSADESPRQEATRTVVDNSIYMFLGLLRASPDNIKVWP